MRRTDQTWLLADVTRAPWTRQLVEIPSTYGQMVYLAGLRNPDTGRYEHYGVEDTYRNDVHASLKGVHERIFSEWVALSLERKKTDIELYIAGLRRSDEAEIIDAWLRLTPYKNLVPAAVQGPERQKHVSDFEAILGLLRNVYGVPAPDRT